MGRWTNSVDGKQRINLRVTFRLTVKDLAEILASGGVHGADATELSAAQIRKYIDAELYGNGMAERDNVDSFPVTQAHYVADRKSTRLDYSQHVSSFPA